MDYNAAVEYVHSRKRLGSRPGLGRITELMRRLGDVHKGLQYIHIAGTNGKGSTTTTVASVLTHCGYTVGKFTSPYLHHFNERIEIDGQPVPDDDFVRYIQQIIDVTDDTLEPTEFEVLMAAASLHYAAYRCDYVALEVGMGGRLDMTNVIPPPDVAVITRIDFDHMQYLGDTLSAIAYEKCGIIKTGSRVIAYPSQPDEALEVIRHTCDECGVTLTIPDLPEITHSSYDGNTFNYHGHTYHTPLAGPHQALNAVTSIEAINALNIGITPEQIANGMAAVKLHGRFEVVSQSPTVIMDVGHNLNCITAVRSGIETYFPDQRIILVMGVLSDKQYAECAEHMADIAKVFIATQTPSPRTMPAAELAACVPESADCRVAVIPDRFEAYRYALSIAEPDDVVLVCGSFTLLEQLI